MAKRQTASTPTRGSAENEEDTLGLSLPKKERTILNIFREYLMTPGKMLCLSSLDGAVYDDSLQNLVDKGLLIAERVRNSYSLTQNGYEAMRDGGQTPA